MKNIKQFIIWTGIALSCLLTFTFADDITKVIQAAESNAKVVYNGKEVNLGAKPFLIEGSNYLSVRALAVLFEKNIDWNQKEQKVIISDKPNMSLEGLKSELAAKDKSIAELQDKARKLENDIASSRKLDVRELQDEINHMLGEFSEVYYRVVLSGNEDEIRVKIEVDLSVNSSSWSRLSSTEREELAQEVCDWIASEYDFAKIKGYIIDIDESEILMPFQNNWKGDIERSNYTNYSNISRLEDRLNEDYANYFEGMHISIALRGNDNNVEYTMNIQESRFNEEWEDISDSTLKSFMKSLCIRINSEFSECYVFGYVYDTDSESELAYCEQIPDKEFIFQREQ